MNSHRITVISKSTCPTGKLPNMTIFHLLALGFALEANGIFCFCYLLFPSLDTVNVEIFAQYIFSRISRMVSDARKNDVSENIYHYRLDDIR